MNNTALKVYALEACIFTLPLKSYSRERIRKWKSHALKLAVISREESPPRNGVGDIEIDDLMDMQFSLQETMYGTEKAIETFLSGILDKLGVPAHKSVLISNDPIIFRNTRKKEWAMLIGIRENGPGRSALLESGCHIVVDGLDCIDIYNNSGKEPHFSQTIPNVFSDHSEMDTLLENRKPVFFFDYDGTLTPIVKDPDSAVLTDETRDLLSQLAQTHRVAVVSGRDMDVLREFIRLDGLIYAGSHGFRISGPDGLHMEHEDAREYVKSMDDTEAKLRESLENEIRGVKVERKHYAIAVHYRNAPERAFKQIENTLDQLVENCPDYKIGKGKKVMELKPSLDWHKGRAVNWIMDQLHLSGAEDHVPVYLGDDITDEDAFRSLADDGIGIIVGDHGQPSAARYRLENVEEVNQFLYRIIHSE